MTTQNEQFQKYIDTQREAFEPFRAYGDVAAQAFERLIRQNYAVLGDFVEFAVEQTRLPTQVADLNDYVGKQVANTRSFGEKLAKRTQEYAEIARSAQDAASHIATEKRSHKKAA